MSAVYFTLAAIVLYVLADRLLDLLEHRAGHRFENRSLIFFGMLLVFSVASFAVIRRLVGVD